MNDKVPIQQVLDDMYSDKGPVTWAARDYYYTTYATPEEQKENVEPSINPEEVINQNTTGGYS